MKLIMKKGLSNATIIIVTCVFPLLVLHFSRDNSRDIQLLQYVVFGILFVGSALLTYLNWDRKTETKFFHFLFKILGVVGILYSGAILWLLFSFRHGFGF
jgi:hypothetical protein